MRRTVARARSLASWAGRTLGGRVVRRVIEDRATSQAVLIAWSLLQTLFPVALTVTTVLGLMLNSVGLGSQVVIQALAAAIPDQAGQQQVLTALAAVHTRTGLLAALALAGFLWSASSLFGSMEQAFDGIFDVPVRPLVRQKLMAVAMMLILVVFAGLAIATSSLLPLLSPLAGLLPVPHGPAAVVAQVAIGTLSGFVLFAAIYHVVPNRRQRLRQVWPGALFAGAAFELLTLAFPLYLVATGAGTDQYGKTFGLLFVLTGFLYLVGLVLMVGVELNAVLYPVTTAQASGQTAARPSPESRGGTRLRRIGFGVLGTAIGLAALIASDSRRRRG
jgi:membrane protein